MSDPQHFGQNTGHGSGAGSGPGPGTSSGLDELVQRIRAFSEPVTDARQGENLPDARPDLRPPYRGAPLPIGPASNGARYEAYEDVRMSPPPIQPGTVPQPPPHQASQPAQSFNNGSYRSQYQPPEHAHSAGPNSSEQYSAQAPSHPAAPAPYSGYPSGSNGNGSQTNGRYTTAPQAQQSFDSSSGYLAGSQTSYPSNLANPQRAYSQEQISSERAASERFAPEKYNPEHRNPEPRNSDNRDRDRSVSELHPASAFGVSPASSAGAAPPQFGNGSSAGSNSNSTSDPAPTPAASTAQLDPNSPFAGFQRAINAVRSTLPLVQRLLPLLDGNLTTAINALVAQQPASNPPPSQQARVDLAPIERSLTEVRNNQRELRTQVLEQITTFKRVEDQLDRVREATDRNTLEQQELVEDIRSVGNRVSTFALVGVVLLVLLLGINVFFLVQLQHILR